MLVVFSSETRGDVTLFGEVAEQLLKMMGQSGTVPGAINAEDIPAALKRLQQAIEKKDEASDNESHDNNDEGEKTSVNIKTRAFPLIEMLEAAAEADSYVKWNKK